MSVKTQPYDPLPLTLTELPPSRLWMELAEGRAGSEDAEGNPGMVGSEPAEGRLGSEPAEGRLGSEPAEGRLGSEPAEGRLGTPVVHTVRPLLDEAVTDPPPCEVVMLPEPSMVAGMGSAGVAGELSHCDRLGADVDTPGKVGSDPTAGSGEAARSDVGFGSDGVATAPTLAPLGNAPTTPSAAAESPAAPAAIMVILFFTFIIPLV
jgi:hypothetical protein